MRPRLTAEWPPEENVSIDRLAFLAAKPYLLRRARPWWLQLLRASNRRAEYRDYRGRWTAGDTLNSSSPEPIGMADEIGGERMRSYVRACDLAAAELSAGERAALRERGELPVWFWAVLDQHAAAERARH